MLTLLELLSSPDWLLIVEVSANVIIDDEPMMLKLDVEMAKLVEFVVSDWLD